MSEKIRAILDAVADRVLAYRPADKGQQAKKVERRGSDLARLHPPRIPTRLRMDRRA